MNVALFINYPATYWSQGGGETVYFKTLQYLNNYKDCTVERLIPPTNTKYDIVHLIGSNFHLNGVVESANNNGAKTIVSSIWYTMKPEFIVRGARALKYFPIDTKYNLRRSIFEKANVILANSEIEKKQIEWAFGIHNDKIKILKLCVDKDFSDLTNLSFSEIYNINNYILCVARINSRKNQINLLKVAEKIGVNIVFIGKPDPSESEYVSRFQSQINKTNKVKAIWIKGLPHDSPILKSAYKNALVHVLPSKGEFPGLSSLEAAMSGTNIVVADAPTVREYFGDLAIYCDYKNPKSMEVSIEKILNDKNRKTKEKILQDFMIKNYTWEVYRENLYQIYKGLLTENG